ncbi:MAG: hypothetical protein P8X65_03075 [Syntrophobacterales bacterium]|jgi:hypothetical protein
MRTMTIIVLAGLVLLFLGSLFIGPKVFSSYERSLDSQLSQAEKTLPPAIAKQVRKRVNYRKVRLALSSFDLVGGLTNHDLEAIPTYSRAFSFYFLLACLWLVLGLRKPRRE